MKRKTFSTLFALVLVLSFSLVTAVPAAAAPEAIVVPDDTLSASGLDGYAYVISTETINAQDVPEAHVAGKVTAYSFANVNQGWFEIGLITKYQRERALTTYNAPSFMFNHSVFMMAMKGGGGDFAMPSDYAGDFLGGTGEAQAISAPFDFDLKLVPNIGGTGGMAYLSINDGPYGTGLPYGTDNWNNYGWSEPDEDLSEAYLIVQLYTSDSSGGSYSVSFEEITAVPEPMPVDIDIKPGSDPNSINLKSKGVVPVAVLTTDDFDANDVDPSTVEFAGAEPVRWVMCDVDDDSDIDMLFHFKTQELVDLDENSTEATLVGTTYSGTPIQGTDVVNIVPTKKGK